MKKDKLYKVNKFNRGGLLFGENLFVNGGMVNSPVGNSTHSFDFGNSYSDPGSTSQMRKNSFYLKGLDQLNFDAPLEDKGLNIGVGNLADASAKTMNQDENKAALDPALARKDLAPASTSIVQDNTPKKSGITEIVQKAAAALPLAQIANNTAAVLGTTNLIKGAIANTVSNAAKPTIQAAAQAGLQGAALDLATQRALQDAVSNTAIKSASTTAGTTASAAANASKFSQALGASKLGSVGSAGVGIAGSLVGMGANKLISDGYDTTAGNMVSDIGGTIGGVVGYFNPVIGAIISAVTGAAGGVVNRGFGMKTDYKALANAKNAIAQNNAMATGATSFDDIQSPISATADAYEGGWWRGRDEDYNEEKLRNEIDFSKRNVENALENLDINRRANIFRHTHAFGGPLETIDNDMKDNIFNFGGDMPATDYNFLDMLLTAKKDKQAQNSNMANMFAGSPNSMFAIGGDLQTSGSDWSTGLTHVDAGQSHELNPNDGVQMGVDSEGTPNLVEEGEVVFNDYVFSNRIPVDQTTKEKFHLPKKKDITYADLAKKLEKEISEHPNDPLSQAGFKAQMEQLEEQQERQKQEMEAERAKAAFEALSPEEQTALMQRAAQEEQMAQQAAQQQAIAEQQAIQQPTPEEIAMAQQAQMQADGSQAMVGQQPQFANGGRLYADGGLKKKLYTLLGRATDSDFKSWLEEMGDGKLDYEAIKKLVDKGDWESLRKNEDFVKALGKENRGLAHSISTLGNNLGLFTPTEASSFFTDPDNGNWDRQLWQGWKDSKDDAWLELVDNMKTKYPDDWQSRLKEMKTPDLEKLFKNTNAYKKTTEWLRKDPENMRKYLENVLKTSTSSSAKEHALQFINEDGTWKDASKLPSYTQVFGENGKGVRETYPGTYWHSVREANRGKQNLNYLLNDDGTVELIEGTTDGLSAAGNYAWQGADNDMTVNYYTRPVTAQKAQDAVKPGEKKVEDERNVVPVHKDERLRYAGLFGPAIGLGMQALGIGKPDYGGIDAAIAAANQPAHLADIKYIGDYMRYNPLDRQYYINQLEANSRATDRALLNSNSPSRAAGLLANGYNTTLGLGNLARQAEEYNRAQYEKTKEFNRGTNMFNAQAYNQNQQFNAEALNRAKQYSASLGLQGAAQKLDADAGWYNGIYGNVAGLFKGLGDLGKENATRNTVADMAASGIYGTINPDYFNPNGMLRWETDKEYQKRMARQAKQSACGGKLKKKGKRGLTF